MGIKEKKERERENAQLAHIKVCVKAITRTN